MVRLDLLWIEVSAVDAKDLCLVVIDPHSGVLCHDGGTIRQGPIGSPRA
jgi:hypothetical protein